MASQMCQLVSASATTSTTTTSKTNATSAAPSPQDAAFIQDCITKILTTPLPALAELHPGFDKLLPGKTPKRPMNMFIMFKAWVSKVVGPSAALKAGKIWEHLKTISPRSQILAHMKGLAQEQEQAHKAAYPGYVFRPKTKDERKVAKPYTRPTQIWEDEQPVASGSGSMPQAPSEETAPESGAELITAQEELLVPYGITYGVQAYPEGSFVPYPTAASNIPEVEYSNQGYVFNPIEIPEIAHPVPRYPFNYTRPSPTPSLGMSASPPENFGPFKNLLSTPPFPWDLFDEEAQEIENNKGVVMDSCLPSWEELNELVAQLVAEPSYMDATQVGF